MPLFSPSLIEGKMGYGQLYSESVSDAKIAVHWNVVFLGDCLSDRQQEGDRHRHRKIGEGHSLRCLESCCVHVCSVCIFFLRVRWWGGGGGIK